MKLPALLFLSKLFVVVSQTAKIFGFLLKHWLPKDNGESVSVSGVKA
jgi:hypothetical protein